MFYLSKSKGFDMYRRKWNLFFQKEEEISCRGIKSNSVEYSIHRIQRKFWWRGMLVWGSQKLSQIITGNYWKKIGIYGKKRGTEKKVHSINLKKKLFSIFKTKEITEKIRLKLRVYQKKKKYFSLSFFFFPFTN